MVARLSINLVAGTLEADGSQEFVDRIYGDLKDLLLVRYSELQRTSSRISSPTQEDATEDDAEEKPRKTRRKAKSTGPSCASRILALKQENFFDALRTATDVGEKLREKGTAYEGKHVAAALLDLVKRGLIRRVSQNGSWSYQNP